MVFQACINSSRSLKPSFCASCSEYVTEALLEAPGDFDCSKPFREVFVFNFVGVPNYPSGTTLSAVRIDYAVKKPLAISLPHDQKELYRRHAWRVAQMQNEYFPLSPEVDHE